MQLYGNLKEIVILILIAIIIIYYYFKLLFKLKEKMKRIITYNFLIIFFFNVHYLCENHYTEQ